MYLGRHLRRVSGLAGIGNELVPDGNLTWGKLVHYIPKWPKKSPQMNRKGNVHTYLLRIVLRMQVRYDTSHWPPACRLQGTNEYKHYNTFDSPIMVTTVAYIVTSCNLPVVNYVSGSNVIACFVIAYILCESVQKTEYSVTCSLKFGSSNRLHNCEALLFTLGTGM